MNGGLRYRREGNFGQARAAPASSGARSAGIDSKSFGGASGRVEKVSNSLPGAVDRDGMAISIGFRGRVCGFHSLSFGSLGHHAQRARRQSIPATIPERVLESPKTKRVRLETKCVRLETKRVATALGWGNRPSARQVRAEPVAVESLQRLLARLTGTAGGRRLAAALTTPLGATSSAPRRRLRRTRALAR
jgi:hypothetical protein